jgi:hypothetical protein
MREAKKDVMKSLLGDQAVDVMTVDLYRQGFDD